MKTLRNLSWCFLAPAMVILGAGWVNGATQIIKGPYLQNVTANSIVVMWETSSTADSRVDYGVSGTAEHSVADSTLETIHEVLLTGLAANTVHYYSVSSGGANGATNRFITAPSGPEVPFRFAVYGDSRTYADDHAAVVRSIIAHDPDFVLHVGDFAQDGRVYSEWGPQFFAPAAPLIKDVPLFGVLGNHEYYGSERMWFYDFLSLANNENWYAFTYGSMRVVALNSCSSSDANASFAPGSAQYQWLVNELKSAPWRDARWRFVFFHHPPYSSRISTEMYEVQDYLVPLFQQYGVHVVFNGHDHNYRHVLRNGIHYIITGAGGAPLYALGDPVPGQVYAESVLEHCILDVQPNTLAFYASRTDGSMMDSFTLTYDTNAPVISSVAAVNITADGAQITWTTDETADSTVEYGLTTAYGSTATAAALVTAHAVDLGNLQPASVYHFRVRSRDMAGNSAVSVDYTFTTLDAPPPPVNNPPSVPEGLTATVSRGTVRLSWTRSTDPDGNIVRYRIFRATSAGGYDWSAPIATSSKPSYTDRKAPSGVPVYYVVRAQDNGIPPATSDPSNEVVVTP